MSTVTIYLACGGIRPRVVFEKQEKLNQRQSLAWLSQNYRAANIADFNIPAVTINLVYGGIRPRLIFEEQKNKIIK
jgi:hypothetical protein